MTSVLSAAQPLSALPASFSRAVLSAMFLSGMVMLSACTDKELILPGERESILLNQSQIQTSDDAQSEGAGLGDMVQNESAGHPGIDSGHAGGHLALELPLRTSWSARVRPTEEDIVTLAQPVIGNDSVYVLGADAELVSLNLENGSERWRVQVDDAERGVYPGVAGGLALSGEVLAAHAARGELALFDAISGELLWSVSHEAPLQGGPTFIDSRAVIVSDLEGQLYTYDIRDGTLIWDNAGLPVSTVVFGSASPAVAGGEVVIAGSGGELSAHTLSDGGLLWADSLASLAPKTPLEDLSDILAHPVHDGQNIIVASQSGRMASFQASTGILNWEQPLSVTTLPWKAGDSLFAVSVDGHLSALRLSDGVVRWQVALDGAVTSAVVAGDDLPRYLAPFVAAGQVHVPSASGRLYHFNADTGAELGSTSLGRELMTPPQIAQGALVVVLSNGSVKLLR